jgi:hypothetical protein
MQAGSGIVADQSCRADELFSQKELTRLHIALALALSVARVNQNAASMTSALKCTNVATLQASLAQAAEAAYFATRLEFKRNLAGDCHHAACVLAVQHSLQHNAGATSLGDPPRTKQIAAVPVRSACLDCGGSSQCLTSSVLYLLSCYARTT